KSEPVAFTDTLALQFIEGVRSAKPLASLAVEANVGFVAFDFFHEALELLARLRLERRSFLKETLVRIRTRVCGTRFVQNVRIASLWGGDVKRAHDAGRRGAQVKDRRAPVGLVQVAAGGEHPPSLLDGGVHRQTIGE